MSLNAELAGNTLKEGFDVVDFVHVSPICRKLLMSACMRDRALPLRYGYAELAYKTISSKLLLDYKSLEIENYWIFENRLIIIGSN